MKYTPPTPPHPTHPPTNPPPPPPPPTPTPTQNIKEKAYVKFEMVRGHI